MAQGGAKRTASYGDGAYQLREHSFGRVTEGKIPKNVIQRGHACADSRAIRNIAKDNGLAPHSAMFPTTIPDFFIRFLTQPGELVVDLFGGSAKVGLAAERLERRWLITEWVLEYLQSASYLFNQFSGFSKNC